MTFLVDDSWFNTPERRAFKEFCERYETVNELPHAPVIAEAVGVCRGTICAWVRTAVGRWSSAIQTALNNARDVLNSVETITWSQLAKRAHTTNNSRFRIEVKRRFPKLAHKIIARGVSPEIVERNRAIVAMYESGRGKHFIARAFGMSPYGVHSICARAGVLREKQVEDCADSVQWERANLVDFVTPDDDYLARQLARGAPILCYPRHMWERYRELWEKKERERLDNLRDPALDELRKE